MTWNSSVQFFGKNMTVQIFTKNNNVWFINFSCMCQRTCFWLSNHKPVQSAPVCVKNRTWYYRGISKRPVKIKGFREVLCSSLSYCQHFFWHLLFNVVGKNCFLFEEQHLTFLLTQEWLEGNLEKRGSFWEPDKDTCTSQHYRQALRLEPQIALMVHLNSKCLLDPQAEDSFTSN